MYSSKLPQPAGEIAKQVSKFLDRNYSLGYISVLKAPREMGSHTLLQGPNKWTPLMVESRYQSSRIDRVRTIETRDEENSRLSR